MLIERWRGVGPPEGLGVIGYRPASKDLASGLHRPLRARAGFRGPAGRRGHGDDGEGYQPDAVRMHRVTWTPRSNGSVEERWQISTDEGRTWGMHFHGLLERIAE